MAKPDVDFAVALSELRQVSNTISRGADFFESQINEGLPVARCVKLCHVNEKLFLWLAPSSDLGWNATV